MSGSDLFITDRKDVELRFSLKLIIIIIKLFSEMNNREQ